jgi:CHAT domain-containing protein
VETHDTDYCLRANRKPPLAFSRRCVVSVVGIGLLSLGVPWFGGCASKDQAKPGSVASLDELVTTPGANRPVEGRLSGLPAFAPFERKKVERDALRGGPRRDDENTDDGDLPAGLAAIAAAVVTEAAKAPSPASLRNVGFVRLFEKKPRRAVQSLEEALALAPDDARLKSDLAAAYVEDGLSREAPRQLARALTLADEAVAADGSLVEARFNLALALERLFLMTAARDAWRDYLTVDSSSPWADEARKRIEALEAPGLKERWQEAKPRLDAAVQANDARLVQSLVGQFSYPARDYARELLGSTWARAVADGRAEEGRGALETARAIGEALAALQGDAFVRDSVRTVDEAEGVRLQALAGAHLALDEGQRLFGRREVVAALPSLEKAAVAFKRASDDAGALRAEYDIARCHVIDIKYDKAVAIVDRLLPLAEKHGYVHLTGRLRWVAGYTQTVAFKPKEALRSFVLASRYLERTGDSDGVMNIQMLLAESFNIFGDRDGAWSALYATLESMAQFGMANQEPLPFSALSDVLVGDGELSVAHWFLKTAVSLAEKAQNRSVLAVSLAQRALVESKLGDIDGASADLAGSREHVAAIDDPAFQSRMAAELALIAGELNVQTDAARAVTQLTEVLEKYGTTSDRSRTSHCHYARYQAHLALGNDSLAEQDLRDSLREIESESSELSGEESLIGFFERPQAVFDDMVAFQVERKHRTDEAFHYSEMSRARALLDELGRKTTSPRSRARRSTVDGSAELVSLDKLSAIVPPDAVVVEYSVQRNAVFIWVVGSGRSNFVRVAVDEDELERACARFRSSVEQGDPRAEIARLSVPLFESLIQPIAQYLPKEGVIYVVPEEILNGVPLGAIVNPTTERYLLAEHALAVCPSASVFARSLKRASEIRPTDAGQPLIVGEPTFDRDRFPYLDALPDAEIEARQIVALYPRAKLLVSTWATKEAFASAARHADVIHFAGHAVQDIDPGVEPFLVFAQSDAGASSQCVLSTSEIRSMHLPRAKVVVLAACRTAQGRMVRGEGSLSLARSFLAAGVPTVVASSWDVRDKVAPRIFLAFHKELLAGRDPASALRLAILGILDAPSGSEASPSNWASLTVFGV